MTKYKYITIWTSYDQVEQKMTELSQEGMSMIIVIL